MRAYAVLGTLVLLVVFTLAILKFNYHYIYNYGKNETNITNLTNNTISQATKDFWKVITNGSITTSSGSTGADKSGSVIVVIDSIEGGVVDYTSCKIEGSSVICTPICAIDKVVFEVPASITPSEVYAGTEDGSKKMTDCKELSKEDDNVKIECDGEMDNLDSGTQICVFVNGKKNTCVALAGSDGCSYPYNK